MDRNALSHLLWILAAGLLGFASAFLLGDQLALPRAWFLLPHVLLVTLFLIAYGRWSGTDLRRLWTRRLVWGVLAAVAVGAFLVLNVVGQPAGARPRGLALVADLVWLGLVYGAVDALLLSVMPVIATWRACKRLGWTTGWTGRLGTAVLALLATAFVTASYHAGYAEFRGPAVGKALIGNVVISASQLVSASPVAAVGSHVAMHMAAVFHGADTTIQLPPHAPGPGR
jgi:hypothetical protein